MPTPCDTCPIRTGCDWLSELCRLTPAEVARLRPDLLTEDARIAAGKSRQLAAALANAKAMAPVFAATRARQIATASLGFKKYDRRLKGAKDYWRDEKGN